MTSEGTRGIGDECALSKLGKGEYDSDESQTVNNHISDLPRFTPSSRPTSHSRGVCDVDITLGDHRTDPRSGYHTSFLL